MLDAAVPEEGPGLSPLHGARFLLALPSAASSIRGLSGSAGQRETSSVLKAWARSRQSGGCVCGGGIVRHPMCWSWGPEGPATPVLLSSA